MALSTANERRALNLTKELIVARQGELVDNAFVYRLCGFDAQKC